MGPASRLKRERRAARAGQARSPGAYEEHARCGRVHAPEAPCPMEEGARACGCRGGGGEDLLFECPTGAIAHAVPLRLDASAEEIERFREEVIRGGPEAFLPCGTCRAGEVFPDVFPAAALPSSG